MTTFTAHVSYGDGWWVAQLAEDSAVMTQTRRLDQIEDELRDALTLYPELTDNPNAASFRLEMESEEERQALRVRDELERLRKQESKQYQQVVELVQQLVQTGHSYRDIAYLFDISHGRVGQIAKKQAVFEQVPNL